MEIFPNVFKEKIGNINKKKLITFLIMEADKLYYMIYSSFFFSSDSLHREEKREL